jgi:hypothetical protein
VAAKLLHAKAKGEKVHLELVVAVRRAGFIQLRQATVDLGVR